MGYFRANISIYVTSESPTQQQEEKNCFLITGLGNFKTIYQFQRTTAMSSFVEPYFDDIFCGIYYSCEVKKKSLRTTLILSCLPPEKAIKINHFHRCCPLNSLTLPKKEEYLTLILISTKG